MEINFNGRQMNVTWREGINYTDTFFRIALYRGHNSPKE